MKPSLQAIWLADTASQDENTGKVTVSGMFDCVEVKAEETEFASPAVVFFALREVHGRVDLSLLLVDLSTDEAILRRLFAVQNDNPLATTDVVLNVPSIPVPHPGSFAWELYWNEESIGTSRLEAVVVGLEE